MPRMKKRTSLSRKLTGFLALSQAVSSPAAQPRVQTRRRSSVSEEFSADFSAEFAAEFAAELSADFSAEFAAEFGASASHVALHEIAPDSPISVPSEGTTLSQPEPVIEENAVEHSQLPEWELLSEAAQQELQEILSYDKVSTYDYPSIFRLNELTQGHPLLFMSWAILASPHAEPLLDGSNNSSLKLLQELDLSPHKFCDFVRAVEQAYPENPYHNRVHASDVLQTLHSFLQAQDLNLSATEHFSVLVAAILHDVGHDGTNNLLHIQKQSSLAKEFQNESVLERYHVQVGLQELEASGLLHGLPFTEQLDIQQRITEAILHTDMAKHQDLVQAYQQGNLDPWQQAMYLLHLSDISSPTKSTGSVWGEMVFQEFFRIGDEQRSLGLPVSPTFDRSAVDHESAGQGFLKHFVLPAFEVVKFTNPKIMQRINENLEATSVGKSSSEEEASSNLKDLFQCKQSKKS